MIVHQDVGKDLHLEPDGQFGETPHKVFPINIKPKQIPPLNRASHHMVKAILFQQEERNCRSKRPPQQDEDVTKKLTIEA